VTEVSEGAKAVHHVESLAAQGHSHLRASSEVYGVDDGERRGSARHPFSDPRGPVTEVQHPSAADVAQDDLTRELVDQSSHWTVAAIVQDWSRPLDAHRGENLHHGAGRLR
jgi:hypothetical protein